MTSTKSGNATTTTSSSSAKVDLDDLIKTHLALEVIPNTLYFASIGAHPQHTDEVLFFTVDHDLPYTPYFADFGPLNICQLVRFSRKMNDHLASLHPGQRILFYTSHHGHQRANAGCLIACYALICHGHTPQSAMQLINTAYPPFLPFRDASFGVSTYNLTIYDCLCGLSKAMTLGWFKLDTFNVEEYEHFEKLENGDWNWIVPGQFIAFSSPVDSQPGREAKNLVRPFRDRDVAVIVRLNEPLYDKLPFTETGIRYVPLQYEDGSIPPDNLAAQFLALAEGQTHGVVAVHCKAGLGRTGTMIGLFCMKHYGLTAKEFIAWSRLCRPGCVIGPQQQYLEAAEKRLTSAGNLARETQLADAAKAGKKPAAFKLNAEKRQPAKRLPPAKLPYTTPLESKEQREEREASLFDPTFVSNKAKVGAFKYNSSQALMKKTPPGNAHANIRLMNASKKEGNAAMSLRDSIRQARSKTPSLKPSPANSPARAQSSMNTTISRDMNTTSAMKKTFPQRSATPAAMKMTLGEFGGDGSDKQGQGQTWRRNSATTAPQLVGHPDDVLETQMVPSRKSPALMAIKRYNELVGNAAHKNSTLASGGLHTWAQQSEGLSYTAEHDLRSDNGVVESESMDFNKPVKVVPVAKAVRKGGRVSPAPWMSGTIRHEL